MPNQTKSLSEIGADLLAEAENRTTSNLPKSTELFPYLLVSARSMSMREISTWLKKEHGVELSGASVSRALAQPNLHLQRLADSISAQARIVALVARTTPRELFECPDDRLSTLEELIHANQRPHTEEEVALLTHASDLFARWDSIPYDVRLLLKPLLDLESDHDSDEF